MVTQAARYVPDRGDLVWISFSPQAGHELAGRRPAVVLTPLAYNKQVGMAIVCPITNTKKGYPFEVPLPPGLKLQGVVLVDQIKSVDLRERLVSKRVDRVPLSVLGETIHRLACLIFIPSN